MKRLRVLLADDHAILRRGLKEILVRELEGAVCGEAEDAQQVLATAKHFAANNQEFERNKLSSDVDERTLREIYLPAFEAAVRMRDRLLQQEVWERLGVDPKLVIPIIQDVPDRKLFQQMLFSKIVPNCKKLGLLDAGDAWLRHRFEDLGVIQFEHEPDTGEEYEMFSLAEGVAS